MTIKTAKNAKMVGICLFHEYIKILEKQPTILLISAKKTALASLRDALSSLARLQLAESLERAQAILVHCTVDLIVGYDIRGDGKIVSWYANLEKNGDQARRILISEQSNSESFLVACKNKIPTYRSVLWPCRPERLRYIARTLLAEQGFFRKLCVLAAITDVELMSQVQDSLNTEHLLLETTSSADKLKEILPTDRYDVILSHLDFDKEQGLAIVQESARHQPGIPVVFLAPHHALHAISSTNVFDVVAWPITPEDLNFRVERALCYREAQRKNAQPTESNFIAVDQETRTLKRMLDKLAPGNAPILIMGEPGSGRSFVSEYIHKNSKNTAGPLIPVECATLPETYATSILFGFEVDVPYEGRQFQPGILEAASGGSVFLDDVDALSFECQKRLYKLATEGVLVRRHGSAEVSTQVRIIASTNGTYKALLWEKKFFKPMADLFEKQALTLAPLRKRPADVSYFLRRAVETYATRQQIPLPRIHPTAREQAQNYAWPGNIPELLYIVEKTLRVFGPQELENLWVDERKLDAHLAQVPGTINLELPLKEALEPTLEKLERKYLQAVLKRYEGQIKHVSDHAQIHRKSLYNKMKQHGLDKEKFRGKPK